MNTCSTKKASENIASRDYNNKHILLQVTNDLLRLFDTDTRAVHTDQQRTVIKHYLEKHL